MTELERLKSLYLYERREYSKGRRFICGIDEAGRGPLAGPVVASSVILPYAEQDADLIWLEGVKDSKKMTSKERQRICELLIQHPEVHVGIGIVSEKVIDDINILQATKRAIKKALSNMGKTPDVLLIDGMTVRGLRQSQKKIIDGDNRSLSIAAASVIAKVTRDNIMKEYHHIYPSYGFDRNKGYGTKEHLQSIKAFGPCRIHRKTFRPISLMQEIGYSIN